MQVVKVDWNNRFVDVRNITNVDWTNLENINAKRSIITYATFKN